jgi:hypothetical protein
MSDTPRTDKIENDWKESWDRSTGQKEMAGFARQLERELNEAKEAREETAWSNAELLHEVDQLESERDSLRAELTEALAKIAGKVHAGAVCIASRKYIEGIEKERDEALAKIEATASLKVELGNRNAEICKLRDELNEANLSIEHLLMEDGLSKFYKQKDQIDSLRAINAELEEAGNDLRKVLHSEFIQEKIAARQRWDKTFTKSKQSKQP